MKIDSLHRIKAIGNLLQYYYSDLNYIVQFRRFVGGSLQSQDYLQAGTASFLAFLKEYRVIRNIEQGRAGDVLALAKEWVSGRSADDVDGFAEHLKNEKCTHGKQMTSLASKILFLNNPWNIIPLDQWNKKALGIKTNRYRDFIRDLRNQQIDCSLERVDGYLSAIENEFKTHLENIVLIRKNRFLDKLLWIAGQSQGGIHLT